MVAMAMAAMAMATAMALAMAMVMAMAMDMAMGMAVDTGMMAPSLRLSSLGSYLLSSRWLLAQFLLLSRSVLGVEKLIKKFFSVADRDEAGSERSDQAVEAVLELDRPVAIKAYESDPALDNGVALLECLV